MAGTINTFTITSSDSSPELSSFLGESLKLVETNKFFISIAGLIVFLAGRSLYNELYDYCSNDINILDYHYVKKITLWCVLFLYSRSIFHATFLSIFFILLIPDIFLTDIYNSNKSAIVN